jgi:hypothetical protein
LGGSGSRGCRYGFLFFEAELLENGAEETHGGNPFLLFEYDE